MAESFIGGMNENSETPWNKGEIFYLDGRATIIANGYLQAETGLLKTQMLITQYDGYIYTFCLGMKEDLYDEDFVSDVFDHIHLGAMKTYSYDNVHYAVPSDWKEDKQYEAGLHFNGTDYEFMVSKRVSTGNVEDSIFKSSQAKFFSDEYGMSFEPKEEVYLIGCPGLLLEATYKEVMIEDHVRDIFIYQDNGYDYIFQIDIAQFGDKKAARKIIESIHIENVE